MGVCGALNSNDQCANSGDDNIQQGEVLRLSFSVALQDLTDFVFRDKDHNLFSSDNIEVQYREVNPLGPWTTTSFLGFPTIDGPIGGLRFKTKGPDHVEFYVSSFSGTEVPVPAALPLLMAGIGGLGLMARRKKRKES